MKLPHKIKREFLYGVSPCLAALESRRRIFYKIIFNQKLELNLPHRSRYTAILNQANDVGCQVQYKHHTVFDRLVGRNTPHQNVMLQVRPLEMVPLETMGDQKSLDNDRLPIWLALDEIQDPMNFGAIIRSALYFGVDKIITSKRNCCRLSPVVSKASSGALEWIPIYDVTLNHKIQELVSLGWDAVGAVSFNESGNHNPDLQITESQNFKLKKPTVIVLGNEGHGINSELLNLCNQLITISPRLPNALPDFLDSLNVSVATGILLHSICKKNN